MKKILYLLLFIPFGLFAQTQVINVGTVANDGTGDPLRTAMQKVNTNFSAVRDSFGNIYREVQTRTLIADSLDALRDSALVGTDYFFPKADSNEYGGAITRSYFETYGGGGGSASKFYYLRGNIDALGFPDAGDTSLIHTNFIGKHLNVYREGQLQQQHTDNTTQDGFWLNNATGEIRVRPAFGVGEQIEIWSTNTIQWESLVPEEGGGEGESTLLTGLIAGWDLDETSGTRAFNVTDDISLDGIHYNGVVINQSGKFGVAYDFDGTNDYVSMGTDAYLRPVGDISISVWVKTTMGGWGTYLSNYLSLGGNFYGFQMSITDAGKVECAVLYGDATDNTIVSTTSIDDGVWHNIIFTYASATDVINVYVDGGASEDNNNVSGTITYHANNQFHLGDRNEGDLPFDGLIDDAYIWSKVLTSDERTELQSGAYPW